MEKKMTTSFNIDKSANKITRPSVFDRIVKEVDAHEIPSKYVEQIVVYYYDGNIVKLSCDEISHPIPLNKDANWENMAGSFMKMKEVKIHISTESLEKDINEYVEQILGPYC